MYGNKEGKSRPKTPREDESRGVDWKTEKTGGKIHLVKFKWIQEN